MDRGPGGVPDRHLITLNGSWAGFDSPPRGNMKYLKRTLFVIGIIAATLFFKEPVPLLLLLVTTDIH